MESLDALYKQNSNKNKNQLNFVVDGNNLIKKHEKKNKKTL